MGVTRIQIQNNKVILRSNTNDPWLEFQVGCRQGSFGLAGLMPFKPHYIMAFTCECRAPAADTEPAAFGARFQAGETQAGAPPTGGWAQCIMMKQYRRKIHLQARSNGQGHN